MMDMYAWQIGGTVVSLAALVTAAAAPAAAAASVGAISTGVYGAARSVGTLVDRGRHEQSVGLKNSEARNCWISVAGSALGIASAKGVQYLTKLTQNGQVLCK
jgi:predicted regulator of Ras-like GTPase activity (Roadblock/LC7/MglB family)